MTTTNHEPPPQTFPSAADVQTAIQALPEPERLAVLTHYVQNRPTDADRLRAGMALLDGAFAGYVIHGPKAKVILNKVLPELRVAMGSE